MKIFHVDRRRFIGAAVAAGAALTIPTVGHAQATSATGFQNKSINFIVGNAAGGPTDVFMRALVPHLTQALGVPIVVENKVGASESIAANFVANSAPDGHTILMTTEAPFTMNPFLYRKLSYNPDKDFSPVTHILNSPMALVVPASSPANTVEELIELSKSRAKDQNPLNYGSAGPGSPIHLAMVSFLHQNKLEMVHLPYRGLAPVVADIVAGRVDAAWGGLASMVPHVRSGKIKALVIDAPERVKTLPTVPVFKETSVPRSQADFVYTMAAPAGTPLALRERIAAEVRKAMNDPEFIRTQMEPYGYVAVNSTPEEMDEFIKKDRLSQAQRIKLSGATMD